MADIEEQIDEFIRVEESTVLILRNLKKLLVESVELKKQLHEIRNEKLPREFSSYRQADEGTPKLQQQVAMGILKEKEQKAASDLEIISGFFGALTEELEANLKLQTKSLGDLQALARYLS